MTWNTLDIPTEKTSVINTTWEFHQEYDGLIKFQDKESEKCFYICNWNMFQTLKTLVIEKKHETPVAAMIQMFIDSPDNPIFLHPNFGMFTAIYQTKNC